MTRNAEKPGMAAEDTATGRHEKVKATMGEAYAALDRAGALRG